MNLAKHARTVTLLVRGDSLRKSMSRYLIREVESSPNISVRLRTEVVDGRAGGLNGSLSCITLADRARDTQEEVPANALFVMIGGEPHTQWLPEDVARDPRGYLLTGPDVLQQASGSWNHHRDPLMLETSMPGVFAAGDVRHGSIKRVASAVGDGATVVRMVHERIRADELAAVAPL